METATEARGAIVGHNVRYVLAFGLLGMVLAFRVLDAYDFI